MHFKRLFYGLLTLAALAIGLGVTSLEPARRVDAWSSDLWHVLAGKRYEPSRVAVVLLDDEALATEPERPLVFWGPLYAKALARLRQAGATVIGMDIQPALSPVTWMDTIGATSSRDFDRAFMLELAKGKTILAASVQTETGEPSFSLPAADYLLALPGHEADLGLTNVPLDRDGVVRQFAPALFSKGNPRLSFATALAARFAPKAPFAVALETPSALVPRSIPFAGPPGTFPVHQPGQAPGRRRLKRSPGQGPGRQGGHPRHRHPRRPRPAGLAPTPCRSSAGPGNSCPARKSTPTSWKPCSRAGGSIQSAASAPAWPGAHFWP